MTKPAAFDPPTTPPRMREGGWWIDRTTDEMIAGPRPATRRGRARRLPRRQARRRAGAPYPIRRTGADGGPCRRAAGHGRRAGRRGGGAAAQLVGVRRRRARRQPPGRDGEPGPSSANGEMAYMLGFAKSQGAGGAQGLPQLRPRADGRHAARTAARSWPTWWWSTAKAQTASSARCSRAMPACRQPAQARSPGAADETAVLMFTSGTTGRQGRDAHLQHAGGPACAPGRARFGLTETDVLLACSPLGHVTGFAAVMFRACAWAAPWCCGTCGKTSAAWPSWPPRRDTMPPPRPFLVDICEAVTAGE